MLTKSLCIGSIDDESVYLLTLLHARLAPARSSTLLELCVREGGCSQLGTTCKALRHRACPSLSHAAVVHSVLGGGPAGEGHVKSGRERGRAREAERPHSLLALQNRRSRRRVHTPSTCRSLESTDNGRRTEGGGKWGPGGGSATVRWFVWVCGGATTSESVSDSCGHRIGCRRGLEAQ